MDVIDLAAVDLCRICIKKSIDFVSIFDEAKIISSLEMERLKIADMIVECAPIDNVINMGFFRLGSANIHCSLALLWVFILFLDFAF